MRRFEIQRLEDRVLLSAAAPTTVSAEPLVIAPIVVPPVAPSAPLIPAQNTPSQALNATVRQQIVNHLNAGTLKTNPTNISTS